MHSGESRNCSRASLPRTVVLPDLEAGCSLSESAPVTATISNPTDGATLATATATTTLTDAESAPSFSISGAASATEGSDLTFTVTRSSGAVAHSESVDWSANGQSGTLTFATGDTSATFQAHTTDDGNYGSESAPGTAPPPLRRRRNAARRADLRARQRDDLAEVPEPTPAVEPRGLHHEL